MAPNRCCPCSCSSRPPDTALTVHERNRAFLTWMNQILVPDMDLGLVADDIDTTREQFNNWVARQCFPIKATITTVTDAIIGAFTGVVWDVVFEGACSTLSMQSPSKGAQLDQEFLASLGGYQPLIHSMVTGSRFEQARSFAVMYGVNSGITCIMNKLRGKDDVQTSMTAAFGSGVMLSLVSGMRGPEVMSVGVLFALLSGGQFKVQEKLSKPKAEDVLHDKTRDRFSCIGLGVDHYAMNFNTCLFTNNALSLHSDRKEMKKGGMRAWFK